MSDSEDMTEFASIVERIERGEVSLIRMIYDRCDRRGLPVNMLRRQQRRRAGLQGCQRIDRDADKPSPPILTDSFTFSTPCVSPPACCSELAADSPQRCLSLFKFTQTALSASSARVREVVFSSKQNAG
ncbi:hypothetical protein Q8A73_011760 [Channa argus]|nr:hypothetical protein Q8A73_011760 [Channa argus]